MQLSKRTRSLKFFFSLSPCKTCWFCNSILNIDSNQVLSLSLSRWHCCFSCNYVFLHVNVENKINISRISVVESVLIETLLKFFRLYQHYSLSATVLRFSPPLLYQQELFITSYRYFQIFRLIYLTQMIPIPLYSRLYVFWVIQKGGSRICLHLKNKRAPAHILLL